MRDGRGATGHTRPFNRVARAPSPAKAQPRNLSHSSLDRQPTSDLLPHRETESREPSPATPPPATLAPESAATASPSAKSPSPRTLAASRTPVHDASSCPNVSPPARLPLESLVPEFAAVVLEFVDALDQDRSRFTQLGLQNQLCGFFGLSCAAHRNFAVAKWTIPFVVALDFRMHCLPCSVTSIFSN